MDTMEGLPTTWWTYAYVHCIPSYPQVPPTGSVAWCPYLIPLPKASTPCPTLSQVLGVEGVFCPPSPKMVLLSQPLKSQEVDCEMKQLLQWIS